MGAVSQLCGAAVLDEHVRPPATVAVLEALFCVGEEHGAAVSALVPPDAPPAQAGTLLVQRELHTSPLAPSARSVCRVNGKSVPLRLLRSLGTLLVDVNGQGSAAFLCDAAAVLALLDARAGCGAEAARFGAAWVWARSAAADAAAAAASAPASQEEAAELEQLVQAVADAAPQPGEDEQLRRRLKRYEAARTASEACAAARHVLEAGAGDALRSAQRELRAVAQRLQQSGGGSGAEAGHKGEDDDGDEGDEALEEVAQALELCAAAASACASAARSVTSASRALQPDPAARDEASARLRLLERLCRQQGCKSVEQLLMAAQEAAAALQGAEGAGGRAEAMRAAAHAARAEMATTGLALSLRRREAARALELEVQAQLAALSMEGARVRVSFEWEETHACDEDQEEPAGVRVAGADALGLDGDACYQPTASGFDQVTLLLATAPGEPLRPLALTASGGERARVMLALKAATRAAGGPAVSLFDEVDAGVGGATGARVGAALRSLAHGDTQRQVLCVTHLPQVAAFAQRHLAVAKAAAPDGRVTTRTQPLHDRADRAAELASMLGLQVAAGEELLRAAEQQLRTTTAA